MATLGIICPPLPGHINPMLVLADELAGRGHKLTFLGFPDMAAKLPNATRFLPFGATEQPVASLDAHLQRLAGSGSLLSLRPLMRDLARFADVTCRTLPAALQQLKPDALIIDQTDSAAGLVARSLGIPYATIANALPMNAEPKLPPPVLPWAYEPTLRGIRRNRGGYRVAAYFERPITDILRQHASRLGRPEIQRSEDCWSDLCQLTQCVKGLDFPREELPATFHYTGPFRHADKPEELDLPKSERPLVFCSLGSLQGARASLFKAVADAASSLDVDLLIAHGGLLAPSATRKLERSAIVRPFVPQRAVLARAALAVTHAGFNTVMDALSFGVPMVALPIAFEQPATGARLKRAGVAEVLQGWRRSGRIRRAIQKVLSDGSYRDNAAKLAAEIATAGGVRKAADLIEGSLGLSAPPAIATKARAVPDDVRDDSRNGSS